jgi:hypothetical protein
MKTGLRFSIIAGLALAGLGGAADAQISPGEALKRSRARVPVAAPSSAPSTTVAAAPASGAFSALHQAHMSEVVFTRTELDRDQMTEAALVNSFTLGDPIFFRVYMREPVIEQLKLQLPGKSNYWVSPATGRALPSAAMSLRRPSGSGARLAITRPGRPGVANCSAGPRSFSPAPKYSASSSRARPGAG